MFIDVFPKTVESYDRKLSDKVLTLDADDIRSAAKQFARWWNDGLIVRSTSRSAPPLTPDEVVQLASRQYSKDYVFCVRTSHENADGTLTVSWDDHDAARQLDAFRLDATISEMCNSWREAQERIDRDNEERIRNLAVIDSARYEEGLRELDQLSARDQLKSRIESMPEGASKAEMMGRFPELFDHDAARAMAQAQRDAEHDAALSAWLEEASEA